MKFVHSLNQTPLIHAAFFGQAEIVRQLLSHSKIDINCKDIFIFRIVI